MSTVTVIFLSEEREYWSIRVNGIEQETARGCYDLGDVLPQAERYCTDGQNAWQRLDNGEGEWLAVTAR